MDHFWKKGKGSYKLPEKGQGASGTKKKTAPGNARWGGRLKGGKRADQRHCSTKFGGGREWEAVVRGMGPT